MTKEQKLIEKQKELIAVLFEIIGKNEGYFSASLMIKAGKIQADLSTLSSQLEEKENNTINADEICFRCQQRNCGNCAIYEAKCTTTIRFPQSPEMREEKFIYWLINRDDPTNVFQTKNGRIFCDTLDGPLSVQQIYDYYKEYVLPYLNSKSEK